MKAVFTKVQNRREYTSKKTGNTNVYLIGSLTLADGTNDSCFVPHGTMKNYSVGDVVNVSYNRYGKIETVSDTGITVDINTILKKLGGNA